MKIRFFNGLSLDKEAEPKNIKDGIVLKEEIPTWVRGVRHHKFIVLRVPGEDLTVVIGPEWDYMRSSYAHARIAELFFPQLAQNLREMRKVVHGGGMLTVVRTQISPEEVSFAAKMSGDSASFGKYPRLIFEGEHSQIISEALDLTVEFG